MRKPTISQLKKKLWELVKTACREKYGNVCFTCGRTGLEGSNWHTGHFIPSSTCGAILRYDLRNLRPQCYFCNIHAGGNGAEFYKRLVQKEGQDYVDKLFIDKNKTIKADILFYSKLIEDYTNENSHRPGC